MSQIRHLKNAPIVEAIIDIRVKLPSAFQVKQFESLKTQLSNSYPKAEERFAIEGGIEIKKGKLTSSIVKDKGLQGYFFKSGDGKQIVQCRNKGFTFNRLKPYTRWEEVIEEAKKLWEIYVEKASPELVTRIAVRYINRLEVPFKTYDFSNYLVAPPNIPSGLPENIKIEGFFNKIVINDVEKDIKANIIQTLDSIDNKFVKFILDIDVYKIHDYNIDDEEVWDTFENLHVMKNQIFFKSLPDKIVELFE
jgi:uncharacterized protein (TIGR04255 family)